MATCEHSTEKKGYEEHSFDTLVSTQEATCSTNGIIIHSCICGKLQAETLPAGHTYSEDWSSDEKFHWYATTCGHTNVTKGKGNHSWGQGVVTQNASCTMPELTTYTCTVCNYKKVEQTKPNTGHTYKIEWTQGDMTHWHSTTCEHSDVKIEESEHEWILVGVTQNASCTLPELTKYQCNVCKKEKIEETASATKHKYASKWSADETYHWKDSICGHNTVDEKGQHDFDAQGVCETCKYGVETEGLLYELSTDRTYYILKGKGTSTETAIIIPSEYAGLPVKEIEGAFTYGSDIISIKIPEGVTTIGERAFAGAENLRSVIIPSTLTEIGAKAFENCRNLTRLSFSNNLISIGEKAFYNCLNLEEVYLGNNIKTIGANAFENCLVLKTINLPASIEKVGVGLFKNCSTLGAVNLQTEASILENEIFYGCSQLEGISYLARPIKIGDYAFYGCTKLTNYTIPETVTSIGISAFEGCESLVSVKIPEGITLIEQSTFKGCVGLNSIEIPTTIQTIGASAFEGCEKLQTIALPNGLTRIGASAFYNCKILQTISIPIGVTSIEDYTFFSCTALTSISIHSGIKTIGNYAFSNCVSLNSVVLPDNVASLGRGAFLGCTGIENVTIGLGITLLDDMVFSSCTNLSEIIISKNLKEIYEAFDGCELAKIYYTGTQDDWNNIFFVRSNMFNGVSIEFNYKEQ